jgi:hypothetical protein
MSARLIMKFKLGYVVRTTPSGTGLVTCKRYPHNTTLRNEGTPFLLNTVEVRPSPGKDKA